MVEPLDIRRATEADLPALTAMTRAFNDYLDAVGGSAPAANAAAIAEAAMDRLRPMAFGANPICTVLIAEWEGERAGYLTYYVGAFMDDATPALHVADFFVDERFRRRGVGSALMREAKRIGATLGASRLLWTVWRKNADAIRFYTALGAESDDEAVQMQWVIAK